jgi:hypothetical protein
MWRQDEVAGEANTVLNHHYIFYTSFDFHQRFDGVMVITFASHSVRERFRVRSSVESLFLSFVPLSKATDCMVCLCFGFIVNLVLGISLPT